MISYKFSYSEGEEIFTILDDHLHHVYMPCLINYFFVHQNQLIAVISCNCIVDMQSIVDMNRL